MDNRQEVSTGGGGDASRPAIGFPLGTALLLLVIFSLSGIFSCCYHWDKIKSLRRSLSSSDAPSSARDNELHHEDDIPSPHKSSPLPLDAKLNRSLSLTVMMPGDRFPKYIAWPSSSEPSPRAPPVETISVEVQNPPLPSPSN